MQRTWKFVAIGGLMLSLASVGCELIVGFDYGLIGQGGGGAPAAGGGGAGGQDTTSSSTTTTTSTMGGGGTGGCVPEDDNLDCTIDTCNPDGTTNHSPAPAGTLCNDGGGTVCDAQGNCQSTCTDGVKNGDETDVDCGGPDCAPCMMLLPNGAPCMTGSQCQSLACVDGVCCTTACTSTCMACISAKTGVADGNCANIAMGTDPDDECAGIQTCTAGTCQLFGNSTPCADKSVCQSGHCVDGVCCSSDCAGDCRVCNSAASPGDCAFIPINQDPMDMECPGPMKACNGVGQCLKITGTNCMNGPECISNSCVGMVCQ